MNWYFEVLKKYAAFGGRARRREYWMFALVNLIVTFALVFLEGQLGLGGASGGFGMLSLVYTLVVLLPSLAVGVRRLHDTGRSGWWLLIVLLPIAGPIALIVFAAQDSEAGSNDYGPNPKGALA